MRLPLSNPNFPYAFTQTDSYVHDPETSVTSVSKSSLSIGTASSTRLVVAVVAAVDTASTGNSISGAADGVTIAGINANCQRVNTSTASESLICGIAYANVTSGTTCTVAINFTNTFSGEWLVSVYTIDTGYSFSGGNIGQDTTPGSDGYLYGSTLGNGQPVAIGAAMWEVTNLDPASWGGDWTTAGEYSRNLSSIATVCIAPLDRIPGSLGGECAVTPTSFTPGDAACAKWLSFSRT